MADEPDVPWTTAPEHVDAILAELKLSSVTKSHARELAERYDGDFGLAPLSVAAGAVYWAALVENDKVTQARVEDASGVTNPTIRRAYRRIAEAEGYDVAPRTRDAGDEDGSPRWSVTLPRPPRPRLGTVITIAAAVAFSATVLLYLPPFDPATTAEFERAAERTVTPMLPLIDIGSAAAVVVVLGFFLRSVRWVVR